MTTNYESARDEMFALLNVAWQAGASAIVGYTPEIRWQGITKEGKVDVSKYWARVSIESVDGEQTTLSDCAGALGQKRYTDYGLVFVQLFAPIEAQQSQLKLGRLGMLARNAYRGVSTDGKVWFRNARIKTIPDELEFHRLNIVAEYQYDELR